MLSRFLHQVDAADIDSKRLGKVDQYSNICVCICVYALPIVDLTLYSVPLATLNIQQDKWK
jgi:hypothetical protein